MSQLTRQVLVKNPFVNSARYVLRFDGASRGNPGHASFGVVIEQSGRGVEFECRRYIGKTTNNVAEYSGLIAGLEAAASMGLRNMAVEGDSKLVILQMNGEWSVRHPQMKILFERAMELSRIVGIVSWRWIPRSANAHADSLANLALDDIGSMDNIAST